MCNLETSLGKIQSKTTKYHSMMNSIADYLENGNQPPVHLIKKDQYLQFYIDKASFCRLLKIAFLKDFEKFACFFGVDNYDEKENKSKITVSFLGVDKNGDILPEHKSEKIDINGNVTPVVDGEEQWGPPYSTQISEEAKKNEFTLDSSLEEIEAFFNKP